MIRTTTLLSAAAVSAILIGGCRPRDEGSSTPQQPPPQQYAGGYGAPPPQQGGYQPPPGQPGPAPGQPAPPPGQYQPQPAPGQPPPGQPPPGQPGAQPAPGGFPGIPGLPAIPGFPLPGGQQPPPQQGGQPAPGGGGASGGTAQPIDPTMAQVATIPLMQMAGQEAPGMQKEGPVLAGNFQAGQSLEAQTQLMPNKCYTILGVGGPGIQELDIQLIALTPIPGMSPVLAQDNRQGANAALGGQGQCFRYQAPFGVNAKWVLTAQAGQGLAAAQLYVK